MIYYGIPVLVTHKPPTGTDGLTLIPSGYLLSVEAHVSNNISGPPSEENSINVDPSSTTILTLDSVEASTNIPIVTSGDVIGKSYLHMT